MTLPSSFLLTINDLQVRCGTKWYEVVKTGKSWERVADNEEPVGNRPKSLTNSPNQPSLTELCAAFTSLVAVVVKEVRRTRDFAFAQRARECSRGAPRSFGRKSGVLRMTNYVSRQSPNSR